MAPKSNPGVSFFIPFHELEPSRQMQCIFFTQKNLRCKFTCEDSKRRAIELHEKINAISSEAVGLDLLQEYVLCNCCRKGNARHRDRIEDINLLVPLAQRWQDEIRRYSYYTTSVPAIQESVLTSDAHTTLVTRTTLYSPIESLFPYQPNASKSSSINTMTPEPVASSSYFQYGSQGYPTTAEFGFQPPESQSRYILRPREANISINSPLTQLKFISQPPQSEFRPHIADPRPEDSVYQKILDSLTDARDPETGSLYIFNRASSPGYVKIGWTAKTVLKRLEGWSKCGYKPSLLFSVNCVPHAQRVETLTHHELIKEWRRERMCKALHCLKSHQEWFEVSREQAEQVLGNWADFMKRAEPYDSRGRLKTQWREVVDMINRNREVVTAKKMLKCYEAMIVEEASPVKKPVGLRQALKVEEVGFGNGPKVGRLETLEKTSVRAGSLLIEERALPQETPMLKSAALPEQTPLIEISLVKAKTPPKCESVHEEVSVSQTTPVKQEIPPKHMPLRPSPPLRPTTFPEDILLSQEIKTKSNSSTVTEETSAIDTITNSDTNITVAATSSKPKLLILPPAPASLLATTSPSATPNKAILPHKNTESSTSTNSPLLNCSDTSSGFNSSDSSATFASPRAKAKLVLNPLAPPSTAATETLLSLSMDRRKESVETLNSITQRQQNLEEIRQAEPSENKFFGCGGQTHKDEIRSHSQVKSTVAEKDTGTGANGWDAEVTLIGDQISGSLEKAALRIVDELCNEIPIGSAKWGLKDLNVVKTLEDEAPPAVETAAQA